MTGAILRREIIVPGRKLHTFLVRGGYSLLLAATFAIIFLFYLLNAQASAAAGTSMLPNASENLFHALVTINVLACLLFTPAYVASAISQEKDQRTMQDLLLTTMNAVEIVVSKLVGRLSQVLLVLAAGLPLVAICPLLGGVSGTMVLALVAMVLMWLVTAGSFTLLISVLVRRTRDAILGSYVLGTMVVIGATIAHFAPPVQITWVRDIIESFYPFGLVSAASSGMPELSVWVVIGKSALIQGVFSAGCVLLTILLLRPLCVRHLEVKSVRRGRRLGRRVKEVPDDRPMLWKEKCFPPSGRITQLLRLLGLVVLLVMCAVLGIWVWAWYTSRLSGSEALSVIALGSFFALLCWPIYLSILLTTSSGFAGERDRATWDAVLTSPLESREIVLGKLVGSLWEVRWWLGALAAHYVLVYLQLVIGTGSRGEAETGIAFRCLRAAGLLISGLFGGSPGMVGLAGQILFALGVGLRVSLRSKSSGKALAMALLIWFGSGIVFWIVVYLVFGLGALFVIAVMGNSWANRVGLVLQPLLSQFMWAGPLLLGLFWGSIGLWLIRRTIVRFDDLASRMTTREVLPLEGLPAA